MDDASHGDEIAILIPAFNEATSIRRVVLDFRAVFPAATVYVYDNGSTDDTAAEAASAGAVVRHERRPVYQQELPARREGAVDAPAKLEQIRHYLGFIDRLTRGYFYSKQWQEHVNASDNIKVRIEDYPIPAHWKTLYQREAQVQVRVFEAMYETGPA